MLNHCQRRSDHCSHPVTRSDWTLQTLVWLRYKWQKYSDGALWPLTFPKPHTWSPYWHTGCKYISQHTVHAGIQQNSMSYNFSIINNTSRRALREGPTFTLKYSITSYQFCEKTQRQNAPKVNSKRGPNINHPTVIRYEYPVVQQMFALYPDVLFTTPILHAARCDSEEICTVMYI